MTQPFLQHEHAVVRIVPSCGRVRLCPGHVGGHATVHDPRGGRGLRPPLPRDGHAGPRVRGHAQSGVCRRIPTPHGGQMGG